MSERNIMSSLKSTRELRAPLAAPPPETTGPFVGRVKTANLSLGQTAVDRPVRSAYQHRHLTVLFSDLSGSVRLAERMPPASYLQLMDHLREQYRKTIARHGGLVARLQGDGLLALFGIRHSAGSEGTRALDCAIELHRDVQRLPRTDLLGAPPLLSLHSGIDAGMTYLEEGDIERGRYDVIGRIPNLAARLCSLARSNEIVATARAIGLRPAPAAMAAPVLLQLRGADRPITAFRMSTQVQHKYPGSSHGVGAAHSGDSSRPSLLPASRIGISSLGCEAANDPGR